ncbi:hypothetical protein LWI29_024701 [Acer saccharum]|uniref:TFIIS N-terminal domain-containing protein n=1 Tax=Acer saccharum TaxID=4024 RepID=A0AA39SEU1_ACESA|nr:hypothetical protein LWI29_024701 [Acer saccharum]KAK1567327.1 hypothetical protein Q3G72_010940 [Acer saccharum]
MEGELEREVMLLLESAVNAADAAAKEEGVFNNNESRCIDLLKFLKDFPITVDVLLSTQIDKHLTHLKNHQREKIRLMAVWLLEIWSNKIKDDRSSSSRNRDDDVLNVISSSHQSSGNYKRKPETCKTKRNRLLAQQDSGFKKQPKARPSRVSKEISNNTTSPDASRNKVREILLEAFSRVACEVSRRGEEVKERVKGCDPVSVAASVESVMFNKMGPYNGAKKLKYRSIMFNVKDPENPDLRRKILLGDIEPELLISLSSEEMASHRRQWNNHRIKQRAYFGLIRKSVDQDSVAKSNGDEAIQIESLW